MANILVVEDEEMVRITLERVLAVENHEVSTASNGNEAIALAKEKPFDLVITDLIMPEKQGIETIVELRRDNPDLKIIAISGVGRSHVSSELDHARQLGADATITKPFGVDTLLKVLHQLLPPPPEEEEGPPAKK
jgi:Response regulator containing CheY-like receiver domain and AraC-type DNA-binding domain